MSRPLIRPRPSAPSNSPRTQRPPLPHANSASTDSKYSSFSSSHRHDTTDSTSRVPLSPPLPPASFNPVPDTHPLLLAAASRHGSSGNLTGQACFSPEKETADSPAIVSPIGDVPPPIAPGTAPFDIPALLSSKSPPFLPMISRGISASSSLSATTPNTTSSNQSSPFHYAEFQNDVGSLQRRLSQERRRRSSAQSNPKPLERSGSISAEELDSRSQSRADTLKAPDGVNTAQQETDSINLDKVDMVEAEQSGMDHLREARQELEAVIEEVVGDVFAVKTPREPVGETIQTEEDRATAAGTKEDQVSEDEPTRTGFRDEIIQRSANTESALASTPASPIVFRAVEAQKNPPLSFEDLVRHRRSSSSASGKVVSGTIPRSGPGSPIPRSTRSRVGSTSEGTMDSLASRTQQAYAHHSPPPAGRHEHVSPEVNQLTMMRRTFSGLSRSASPELPAPTAQQGDSRVIPHDMMVRGPIAPGSILRTRNGVDHKHSEYAAATEARLGHPPIESNEPYDLGSTIQDLTLTDRAEDGESFRPTSSLAALSAEKQYRSRSNSRTISGRETSPATDEHHAHDTHLWDSVWPSAAGRSSHPAASGHVPYPKPIAEMRNTPMPRLPMHSRTMSMGNGSHLHPMPMIHSLSFPAAVPPPPPPPFTSHASGVPLSFSAALSQPSTPCPWPQHPSARRGSIASLGVWPLKRSSSKAVDNLKADGGDGTGGIPAKGDDIKEEEGERDDDNGETQKESSVQDEASGGD